MPFHLNVSVVDRKGASYYSGAVRVYGTEQPGSCLGRLDVTKMSGYIVLVNADFHTRKNLSENCLQFGHAL